MNIKLSQFDFAALLNQPLLPKCLSAIFGILCLFVLVTGIKGLVRTAPSALLSAQIPQGLPSDLQQTLAMPLFGVYQAPQSSSSPLRQSLLSVQVIGIMFDAKDASQSHALIRLDSGEVHSYQVGDTIPGGAIIKRIQADRVVIEFHGELEGLFLMKQSLHFEPPAKPLLNESIN